MASHRKNLPRTPAEISTVAGRHDTWKRCGTDETRTSWQLTVGQDYCATSDNYAPPPPSNIDRALRSLPGAAPDPEPSPSRGDSRASARPVLSPVQESPRVRVRM